MKPPSPSRQAIFAELTAIFGHHSHTATISSKAGTTIVHLAYEDFLSVPSMHTILAATFPSSVRWDICRTMSPCTRHLLLDSLFTDPDALFTDPSLHSDVRLYIMERFTATDFNNIHPLPS